MEVVKRKRGRPRKDPNAPPKVKVEKKTTGKRRGRPPKNTVSNDIITGGVDDHEPKQSLLASDSVKQTYADHNRFMQAISKLSLNEVVGELVKDLELDMAMLSVSEHKYLHFHKRKALIERMKECIQM